MSDTRISTEQLLQVIGTKQVQIEILVAENEQLRAGLANLKAQFDELKDAKKKPKKEESVEAAEGAE
jgi:hypothetical protein